MATQKWGVYSCDVCGNMEMRADVDVKERDDLGDPIDDAACCLVRDTHHDEHDVCHGTVSFKGFLRLEL